MTRIINTTKQLKAFKKSCTKKNKIINFVPTMGSLHKGHEELIKKAKKRNGICVTSIFVNPLQFSEKNDYLNYPKNNNQDLKILEDSFNLRKESHNPDFAHINRNEKWLDWRLNQCPYKKDIHFFKYNNNFAIVHIYSAKNIKRLNVLFTYYTDYSEEDKLYSLIIKWSLDNNIDFIWLISKSKKFQHIFPKIFNKPLRFASWSSDQDIFEILKKGLNDLQGIDSDIESGLYIE